ncbi:MAG: type II secretion system F family protein [Dongiaceae bacterium]
MTQDLVLPLGIRLEDLVAVGAALSAILTFAAIWFGAIERAPSSRRVKELAMRREQLKAGAMSTSRRRNRQGSTNFMRQFVMSMNLQRSQRAEMITRKLAQAGWRSNDALIRYLFFKATLPIAFGGVAVVYFYGLNVFDLAPLARLAVTAGGVMLGFVGPDIFVKNAISKRRLKILKGLPDALDLMVICAEAGVALDGILKKVSEEFSTSCSQLAEELQLTSLEIGFLPDRRSALQNLVNRTDMPSIRGLVNALIQSDKYGTPLAVSMRVLANEYREERMMRAEEKAARLPALMTVPMIIFILPPLFIVLIGPAILRLIDAFKGINTN